MDIVRLFDGAAALDIVQETRTDDKFHNRILLDGKEFLFDDKENFSSALEKKSLIKRFAKLSLYRVLSEKFQRHLPWGSLTGIRPTRLAYQQLEKTGEFRPLFQKLSASRTKIPPSWSGS